MKLSVLLCILGIGINILFSLLGTFFKRSIENINANLTACFFPPHIAWTGFCRSTEVNTNDVEKVNLEISLELPEKTFLFNWTPNKHLILKLKLICNEIQVLIAACCAVKTHLEEFMAELKTSFHVKMIFVNTTTFNSDTLRHSDESSGCFLWCPGCGQLLLRLLLVLWRSGFLRSILRKLHQICPTIPQSSHTRENVPYLKGTGEEFLFRDGNLAGQKNKKGAPVADLSPPDSASPHSPAPLHT
ncbi:uncharacterized protein LOC106633074 [Haplochromis burtoni]|uniref:uncharacterized protein LOC106633074 n=1 Tax=Haplochromis burtoni TaxID=8153 RepID=UPI001C2D5833|nr:uncharacterized protein LOC106633074 [Haplochromis burtoni]